MELGIHNLAFLTNMNPWEIGAIVFIVLLLFGAKKLPELARGAGKAIKEFKKVSIERSDACPADETGSKLQTHHGDHR